MIDKDLYFSEVNELLKQNSRLEKIDFQLLYEALNGKITVDTAFLADKIVSILSGNVFTQTMVSWEFLSSEVGKALLKGKFEISNNIYFASDLAEILNCSRQFVSKIVKNEEIKFHKRGGIIYFMEKDVNQYLIDKNKKNSLEEKKKFTYEEAKEQLVNGKFEREEDYK